MADYRYITYETLDEGLIARIMLNRPRTRNAQNRGLLVELNDAFLAAEADNKVRVVILGGVGPIFSSGHDLGSKESIAERTPGPDQHPTMQINAAPGWAGKALDPGMALLLPEHAAVAQSAQDHGGAGAGHRVLGRAHACVGLRPDRRGR